MTNGPNETEGAWPVVATSSCRCTATDIEPTSASTARFPANRWRPSSPAVQVGDWTPASAPGSRADPAGLGEARRASPSTLRGGTVDPQEVVVAAELRLDHHPAKL